MALEQFLRPETSFKTPGFFGEFIRAKESVRAQRVTELDKFYASLEEGRRQFDLSTRLKREELDLAKKSQAAQEEHQKGLLGISRSELYERGLSRQEQLSSLRSIELGKLGLAEKRFEAETDENLFLREQFQQLFNPSESGREPTEGASLTGLRLFSDRDSEGDFARDSGLNLEDEFSDDFFAGYTDNF